jgi:hypothetical protein
LEQSRQSADSHADEQQRLLANAILHVSQDRRPMPRFWYFPRGKKAVVVMTGDEHGFSQFAIRFNNLFNAPANSPAGCSVGDWECTRATVYIYPATINLDDSQVAAYVAQGRDRAAPTTNAIPGGCPNYHARVVRSGPRQPARPGRRDLPSMPTPRTNRTHCIVWSDYTSQAGIRFTHGIRLDTNYYYWPPAWCSIARLLHGLRDRCGSAKQTGELIDVYQVPTQMTDEPGRATRRRWTRSSVARWARSITGRSRRTCTRRRLLRALPAIGATAIVASARALNVPIVTAVQMLDWLDGRNASSFGSMTWDGTNLSFTVTRAATAGGLQGMPSYHAGGPMQTLTRGGSPVAFTVETIKGVACALFDATSGSFVATYPPDLTAPIISSVTATPTSATTANIT